MAWRKIQQNQMLDPRVASMPAQTQILYIRIVVFSDAHGRTMGHPLTLQHQLMLVGWTPTDTAQHLQALHLAGLIDWYGSTDTDAIVQVVGFDESQGHQLIRGRGEPTLEQRGTHHIDGSEIFGSLLQHHSSSSAAVVQQQCSSAAAAQQSREDREDREDIKNNDPITKIEHVFKDATKMIDHTFNDRDIKRLNLVLCDHKVSSVADYLTRALKAAWFWDEKRGMSRRRNAIPTLLNVKKDSAGRTYHQKIVGHWPKQQEQQEQTSQQPDDMQARTLRGDWS